MQIWRNIRVLAWRSSRASNGQLRSQDVLIKLLFYLVKDFVCRDLDGLLI
uniref:Uncharacterized protein n=1 Tax=Arundo donax TaxID=35708 RepID=A0A0A9AAF8_ARUDO